MMTDARDKPPRTDQESTPPPPSTSTSKSSSRVRFVITGFGPFGGVPVNPTSQIADQLVAFLQQQEANEKLDRVVETTILEVSAKAVREFLDHLSIQRQHVVMLHLGVNYRGTGFQLETCAYNDATFRIPDEQGYQPTKESIVPELPWDTTVKTTLNVEDLCQRLQARYSSASGWNTSSIVSGAVSPIQKSLCGFVGGDGDSSDSQQNDDNSDTRRLGCKVFASTDPGRFVCNYTYCYSLNKFCQPPPGATAAESETLQQVPTVWSLFLHVPPVNIIPIDTQLQFVADLIESIQEQITTEKVER